MTGPSWNSWRAESTKTMTKVNDMGHLRTLLYVAYIFAAVYVWNLFQTFSEKVLVMNELIDFLNGGKVTKRSYFLESFGLLRARTRLYRSQSRT